jgi:hypothetical protein
MKYMAIWRKLKVRKPYAFSWCFRGDVRSLYHFAEKFLRMTHLLKHARKSGAMSEKWNREQRHVPDRYILALQITVLINDGQQIAWGCRTAMSLRGQTVIA